ncbi:hypothetical protein [Thauera sp. 63]|uniref:hypothetical protein n=1 Tax=Thauera sp. 63 TaxID=497321 RepID=UPI0002CDBBB4|nr:hypothetical protein [Thauera sp. 63]ENO80302.1 hypothetical protein C664_01130 [Thauera sp. 63]
MKVRPILFSAPMVRAILAGTKTQTRRVVKPQPAVGQGIVNAAYCGYPNLWLRDGPCDKTDPAQDWRCPYGQPGDRLWVREAWAETDREDGTPVIAYRAGGNIAIGRDHPKGNDYLINTIAWDDMPHVETWRPSIHMPRWASRILLEITAIRVERLNEISQSDARAEGAPPSHLSIDRVSREFGFADFPRSWFGQLWEHINGPGSWEANPWVWVVEFRRADHAA